MQSFRSVSANREITNNLLPIPLPATSLAPPIPFAFPIPSFVLLLPDLANATATRVPIPLANEQQEGYAASSLSAVNKSSTHSL